MGGKYAYNFSIHIYVSGDQAFRFSDDIDLKYDWDLSTIGYLEKMMTPVSYLLVGL